MQAEITLLVIAALLLSAAMTGMVRRFALARGVVDVPNQRSSHTIPTPRGGGAAIVVVTTAALLVLAFRGSVPWNLVAALGGGGLVVALVGFLDDRSALSARSRLVTHVAAAIWAVWWLGSPLALRVGPGLIELGYLGAVVAVVAITWSLNLFNFMDGIDGIAGSQVVFVMAGAVALSALACAPPALVTTESVLAAASIGFLLWNWPPARIFMGDVGSGYLGYAIGALAVAAARSNPNALWAWFTLNGVFVVDSTVTLLRRLIRGERVYEAHRSHAYQWQARRFASHSFVTVAVWLINLLWLFPCACLATILPRYSCWIAAGALAPLVLVAPFLGAGRREGSATAVR